MQKQWSSCPWEWSFEWIVNQNERCTIQHIIKKKLRKTCYFSLSRGHVQGLFLGLEISSMWKNRFQYFRNGIHMKNNKIWFFRVQKAFVEVCLFSRWNPSEAATNAISMCVLFNECVLSANNSRPEWCQLFPQSYGLFSNITFATRFTSN